MKASSTHLLTIFVLAQTAIAHRQDMGALVVQRNGKALGFQLLLATPLAQQLTGPGTPAPAPLLAATLTAAPIESNAAPCVWEPAKLEPEAGGVLLSARAICAGEPDEWTLRLGFLRRTPIGYELLVRFEDSTGYREWIRTAAEPSVTITPGSTLTWVQFLRMGIAHIGAWPSEWKDQRGWHLPEGIDHILFLLALVIGATRLVEVLKTVTGFMIGHSITLALSMFGVVHVPSRVVESAIALSIALVALETLLLREAKNRWKIALLFGMIHGLGFASALAELHLDRASILEALVGFNFGIELGQIALVALLFPIGWVLRRTPRLYPIAVRLGSISLVFIGGYWFIQRCFF